MPQVRNIIKLTVAENNDHYAENNDHYAENNDRKSANIFLYHNKKTKVQSGKVGNWESI